LPIVFQAISTLLAKFDDSNPYARKTAINSFVELAKYGELN
jgi:hypothetical protein